MIYFKINIWAAGRVRDAEIEQSQSARNQTLFPDPFHPNALTNTALYTTSPGRESRELSFGEMQK